MSGKIQHTSRPDIYTLNFATTENNLSWSIPNQADGEIFYVETTNVAAYQIKGVVQNISPSSPYPVTGGEEYAISIVKTNIGQAASISLHTRRGQKRESNFAVVDYGQNLGRFLYLLTSNNLVLVLDCNLLKSSNYLGAGVWNLNPLINTITLPSLPANYGWRYLSFVNSQHGELIIVSGGAAVNNVASQNFYSSIRVSDATIWNLNLTIPSAYTQGRLQGGNFGAPQGTYYNYIDGLLFPVNGGGNNGATNKVVIDLSTLTENLIYHDALIQAVAPNGHINPYRRSMIGRTCDIDASQYTKPVKTYYSLSNPDSVWTFMRGVVFDPSTNYVYRNNYSDLGRVARYDINGNIISLSLGSLGTLAYPFLQILKFGGTNTIFQAPSQNGNANNKVCFIRVDTFTQLSGLLSYIPANQTHFRSISTSKEGQMFLAIGASSTNPCLYALEPIWGNSTFSERYLDISASTYGQPIFSTTNQLLTP